MTSLPDQQLDDQATMQNAWRVVVWDDPVNLMSYVTYVFETHFGHPHDRAHALMMQVHTEGRAVVAEGGREPMESHVSAMHSYGLWATLESSG
jgi:ATP-dependent Clp protease adaptor protein ClpS